MLVDTDVLIWHLRGYPQATRRLDELGALTLSAGETQPTLEVIRNMARALSVSADALVFELDERNPVEDLRLQFEAVSQLPPDEQSVVKEVLESLIIKYQTRRWDKARAVTGAVTAQAKAAPVVKATPTKRVAQAGGQR